MREQETTAAQPPERNSREIARCRSARRRRRPAQRAARQEPAAVRSWRPEPVEPEVVPTEETGWLDDLRSAKQDRSAIGPGKPTDGKSSKSGKTAPAPDDVPDDAPPFLSADADPGPRGPAAAGAAGCSHVAGPAGAQPVARPRRLSAVPRHRFWQARGRVARSPRCRAAPAPYAAGPPPGQFGSAGRPVSPPSSAPASGGGAGGARARFQDADGTWHSGSGEYPSGSWRTVPGDGGTGRHTSPLNPDGTDEAGPGRGRRQIDPGQFSGRVDRGRPVPGGSPLPGRPVSGSPTSGGPMPAGPVSAVPMSGNAPAVPTPTSPAGPRRGAGPMPPQNLPGPAAGRPAGRAPGTGTRPAARRHRRRTARHRRVHPGLRHATTPVRRPPGRPARRPRPGRFPGALRQPWRVRLHPATRQRREPGPPDGPRRRLPGTAPRRRRPAGVGHAGTRRKLLRLPQHRHHRTGATGRGPRRRGHRPASVLGPGSRTGPVSGSPVSGSPAAARAPALFRLASTPGHPPGRAVVRSRWSGLAWPHRAARWRGVVRLAGPRGGPAVVSVARAGWRAGPRPALVCAAGQHTGPVARGQRPGPDGRAGGPAGAQHTGPIRRGQRPGPDGLAARRRRGAVSTPVRSPRGQRPDPDGQHAGPVPGGPGPRGQAGSGPDPATRPAGVPDPTSPANAPAGGPAPAAETRRRPSPAAPPLPRARVDRARRPAWVRPAWPPVRAAPVKPLEPPQPWCRRWSPAARAPARPPCRAARERWRTALRA